MTTPADDTTAAAQAVIAALRAAIHDDLAVVAEGAAHDHPAELVGVGIGDVRGRGLMLGVELVTDRAKRTPDGARADAVIARCADAGLLLLTCGQDHNTVRWLAPLNVTAGEIEEGLEVFGRVLSGT